MVEPLSIAAVASGTSARPNTLSVKLGSYLYGSCHDDFQIEEEHVDVMIKNKSGGGALCVMSLGGKLDVVKYLIQERKCDPITEFLLQA